MDLESKGLQIQMNEFRLKVSISEKDFMINVLNNLPEEYDVILDVLKNCLTASGDNVLTIYIIWYKELRIKKKKKLKQKWP